MIPLQLSLKNFLSYSQASLDFTGLHTACICGANGAGKSSLLEGITWAIWGECRAASEDDAITNGAMDVRVDFTFKMHSETYRIVRTRQRDGNGGLEFQIQTSGGQFRTLTQKGIRSTQAAIEEYLKIDYETFINSAYLRQGKADEFMLKKPTERKQILADLLKLDRYEQLADKAKDTAKQYKVKSDVLTDALATDRLQLERVPEIVVERDGVKAEIDRLQQLQAVDESELASLRAFGRLRETWQQQLAWEQKRDRELGQAAGQIQADIQTVNTDKNRLECLINRSAEIASAYSDYLDLQRQVEVFDRKFDSFQQWQTQQQDLQQQLANQTQALNLALGKTQAELGSIGQQQRELADILATAGDVEKGMVELQYRRQKLVELDRLQTEVLPWQQERNALESQIALETAKMQAKLNEVSLRERQVRQKTEEHPQLTARLVELDAQISELDKKKVHQKRIEEKGTVKRDNIQKLEADIRNYQRQSLEIDRKLELLQTPDASCPVCDRALDEHHWEHVLNNANNDRERIAQQISASEEERSRTERERQGLREEYAQLQRELAEAETLRERRGKLQAQLDAIAEFQVNLEELIAEKLEIALAIETKSYANDLQLQLQEVVEKLAATNYSDQSHALARGDVDKLRWAEIKQEKIKDAERKQQTLADRHSQLEAEISRIEGEISNLQTDSELKIELQKIATQIAELGYDRHAHNQAATNLRQLQSIQLQYQELQQAQQTHPQVLERLALLATTEHQNTTDRQQSQTEIERITNEIAKIPNHEERVSEIERQLTERRRQLDEHLATSGSVDRQLAQLEEIRSQLQDRERQLDNYKQQYKVYDELSKAFGKNGIQALVIENILPQLEAESNQILSKLSNNQFHVQFITQKATKGSRTKKASVKSAKYIDTLDIVIGDANGTRAYETYSGGEAFRINFSIRLALAKLLSQRAGTPLQMLIVDEGFGTQDREGCERLIAAINAISSDFACILTVTHMPQFREAFQTRIEVHKTTKGSQLKVIS